MNTGAFWRRLAATFLLICFVSVVPASAASTDVVATGLNDPRGIDAADGDHGDRLLVAQTGSGEITEILTRKGDSTVRPFATLPSDLSLSGIAAYGFRNAYALVGPNEENAPPTGRLVRIARNGTPTSVADIAAYQAGDPDPFDQEGAPEESNPFGITLLRHGVLVTDAAGNDLLRIAKDGSIETVARFPTRTLPFPEGVPDGPPPGTPIEAEAVPTAVAVGPDGAWYVSELRGFPFTKGASRIWRIEPGTEDVTCDPDAKRGPCRLFADGFTSVIDLTFAGDTMLVLELAKDGLLALESGGEGSPPPPGALWALDDDSRTEIVPGSLVAPGGVAVADEDRIYVTTGTLFGPGGGAVVRIKDALDDDDEDDHRGGDRDHGDRRDKQHKHKKHDKHHKRDKHHDD